MRINLNLGTIILHQILIQFIKLLKRCLTGRYRKIAKKYMRDKIILATKFEMKEKHTKNVTKKKGTHPKASESLTFLFYV
jgi:hypothetical protein